MTRCTLALPLALLVACTGGQADIDDTDLDRPDITGAYTADLGAIEGCPADATPNWSGGPILVEGAASDLSFVFGDDVLVGEVDASFVFTVAGTVHQGDTQWVTELEGLAYLEDAGWHLDGDLVADVVDSTTGQVACTLTARWEAVQDAP